GICRQRDARDNVAAQPASAVSAQPSENGEQSFQRWGTCVNGSGVAHAATVRPASGRSERKLSVQQQPTEADSHVSDEIGARIIGTVALGLYVDGHAVVAQPDTD